MNNNKEKKKKNISEYLDVYGPIIFTVLVLIFMIYFSKFFG